MLTEPQRLLVASAVDGRLSPADESAFRALVVESRDALSLFQTLQTQSARLRALPRAALPAARAAELLRAIANVPAPVAPPVLVRPGRRPVRELLPYAVAASTLFAVATASFLASNSAANRRAAETAHLPVLPRVAHTAVLPTRADEPAEEFAPREVTPPAIARADVPAPDEVAPAPRVQLTGEVVGSGVFQQPASLTALDVRLPLLTSASKLDHPETRRLTAAEFAAAPALRLDLFSRDTARAAHALQAAAAAVGVTLAVDGLTAERLKKGLPLAWAAYTESLTPAQTLKWLDQVAVMNREAGTDAPFGSAHLTPATAADARELRDLLGVETAFGKRPPAGPATTADQVALSLTKPTHAALLLTFGPAAARTPPAASVEVRAYLAGRGERKPGVTPLLIVVRPAATPR